MIEHLFGRAALPLLIVWLAGCAGGSQAAQPTRQALADPSQASGPRQLEPPAVAPVSTPSSAPAVVTIAMPVYKQEMALDCETAALQMALASLGHPYSQPELFQGENPDNTLPIMNADRSVKQWGNPYVRFVGNVNGSDLAPTGYGVYYPVILAIARSHGAPGATGGEGYSSADVYAALQRGRPVMVWVETGWERVRYPLIGTWTAWDGRPIHYSLIEHTVTLSGVSATRVRVNDPWRAGSQYWIGKGDFESSWGDFNNMAVIF